VHVLEIFQDQYQHWSWHHDVSHIIFFFIFNQTPLNLRQLVFFHLTTSKIIIVALITNVVFRSPPPCTISLDNHVSERRTYDNVFDRRAVMKNINIHIVNLAINSSSKNEAYDNRTSKEYCQNLCDEIIACLLHSRNLMAGILLTFEIALMFNWHILRRV